MGAMGPQTPEVTLYMFEVIHTHAHQNIQLTTNVFKTYVYK